MLAELDETGADQEHLRLRERFDEALVAEREPQAVVLAAADWWQAAGIGIPVSLLHQQAARRMSTLAPGCSLTPRGFEAGLAWATAPPALLVADDAGRYELADGIPLSLLPRHESLVSETGRPVTPMAAVALAARALSDLRGDREVARSALSYAIDGDDADAAALARWHLLEADLDDGDRGAARAGFERIVQEGHFAIAPRAMFALARLDFDARHPAAEELLQRAIDCRHRLVTSPAARLLRDLRLRHDDEAGAITAGRIVFDCQDPLLAAFDGRVLAALLVRSGEDTAAEQVLRQVIDLEDLFESGRAAADLARILIERGEYAEAERELTEALTWDVLHRADLQIALAGAHLAQGDLTAAEELIDKAKASDLPPSSQELARMGVMQAHMALAREDDQTAADIYTDLLGHPDRVTRQTAHELVLQAGTLLARGGPCAIPGLAPPLRHLMVEADTPVREWAAYGVGRIAESEGNTRLSGQAYRIAACGANPDYAVRAARKLAAADLTEHDQALNSLLQILEGDAADAVAGAIVPAGTLIRHSRHLGFRRRARLVLRVHEACLRHIEAGDPYAAHIAFALGTLHFEVLGRPRKAIEPWEIAADSDDADIKAAAAFNLGLAHAHVSQSISAVQAFQTAIATGHFEFAPKATYALGQLAEELHDLPAATDAYLQALTTEHPEVAPRAAFQLACLVRRDQPDDAESALQQIINAPEAPADITGAAYAQLGRIYAENGNRKLARRFWHKGKRHADHATAAAFAAERKKIGRVTRRPR
ncbi:hypothetical protein AGRA3207_007242 [Actinomadura graeca]|uniref:Tetratricopeptide repeat protein n=1 Tax=Actinomadura graeca TaxID=2750812 RepID=A0ABX8R4E3_9ACTN|nr:hypothetical protein [Actinomadura graeca]QXJ25713.1 hypothetical protein AGRA3207_007242 [Actinomadura graeca]